MSDERLVLLPSLVYILLPPSLWIVDCFDCRRDCYDSRRDQFVTVPDGILDLGVDVEVYHSHVFAVAIQT